MAAPKKRALGRGLDALLAPEAPVPAAPPPEEAGGGRLSMAPIERLTPGLHQPRLDFDDQALDELAESIRLHGVLQPILVRGDGERLEIVAGERRWRAARLAGLEEVPVLALEAAGDRALEIALIENVQRADLNPIEEASAFAGMMDRLGLTQEEVAARVGKERSTVANYIRLLRLPDSVQELVAAGDLSMGHARALLALRSEKEIEAFARAAVERGMSVRQLEERVRKALAAGASKGAKYPRSPSQEGPTGPQALFLRELGERLRRSLGTKVVISGDETKGRIVIEYYSGEMLEGLVRRLS